jgi:hypothetical protein
VFAADRAEVTVRQGTVLAVQPDALADGRDPVVDPPGGR